ncbi:MAG: hypothetical protein J6S75_00570 [Thermoguttaceae bacterium]|nr:hypothetical protein [Thermoguttaceae bacterium]
MSTEHSPYFNPAETISRDELLTLQNERLKKIVRYAAANNDVYRDLFAKQASMSTILTASTTFKSSRSSPNRPSVRTTRSGCAAVRSAICARCTCPAVPPEPRW